jgi:hypothetical protein
MGKKFIAAAAAALAVAAPAVVPAGASAMTFSQHEAVSSAQDYLSTQAFSKSGLYQQLYSSYGEGFSKRDAWYAVTHIRVNWYRQAVKSAHEYLSTSHFSKSGLYQQLVSSYGEGFTPAQARYAVNKVY